MELIVAGAALGTLAAFILSGIVLIADAIRARLDK